MAKYNIVPALVCTSHEGWCVSLHGQTPFHTDRGKRSGTWPPCALSLRNLLLMSSSHDNVCQVRLPTLLHSHFRFVLHSSSRLETLLAQFPSHTSCLFSTHTQFFNHPVDQILRVACDWILHCDWWHVRLGGVGGVTTATLSANDLAWQSLLFSPMDVTRLQLVGV